MGPPLKAAENYSHHMIPIILWLASMGPPLKAAENKRAQCRNFCACTGFNGAAAKSSGK